MSYLGRAEEECDGLMQVSLSNFSTFEQSRARAHLKSNITSEHRLSSLPIIMLNAEYIVYKSGKTLQKWKNFTKVEGYLKLHFWSY